MLTEICIVIFLANLHIQFYLNLHYSFLRYMIFYLFIKKKIISKCLWECRANWALLLILDWFIIVVSGVSCHHLRRGHITYMSALVMLLEYDLYKDFVLDLSCLVHTAVSVVWFVPDWTKHAPATIFELSHPHTRTQVNLSSDCVECLVVDWMLWFVVV